MFVKKMSQFLIDVTNNSNVCAHMKMQSLYTDYRRKKAHLGAKVREMFFKELKQDRGFRRVARKCRSKIYIRNTKNCI